MQRHPHHDPVKAPRTMVQGRESPSLTLTHDSQRSSEPVSISFGLRSRRRQSTQGDYSGAKERTRRVSIWGGPRQSKGASQRTPTGLVSDQPLPSYVLTRYQGNPHRLLGVSRLQLAGQQRLPTDWTGWCNEKLVGLWASE